jgi:hypothetical protein
MQALSRNLFINKIDFYRYITSINKAILFEVAATANAVLESVPLHP